MKTPFARWMLPLRAAAVLVCTFGAAQPQSRSADPPAGLAAAASIEEAFVSVIATAEKSVVSIARVRTGPAAPPPNLFQRNAPFPMPDRRLSADDPAYIPNEFGAGIVIDENGLVLTNYHLVRGGPVEGKPDIKPEQEILVRLPDRRAFRAAIFAADPRSDLAVIRIPAAGLKPLKPGSGTPPRKGQLVVALGNPYAIARDGSASASWGIIGNIGRHAAQDSSLSLAEARRTETMQHLGTLLQVDTRLELGTSGGALLNLRAELIGITTSMSALAGYEKASGFAMPIDETTLRIIETLRQGKEVEYGFLGIMPKDVAPSETELAQIAARFQQYGAAKIENVVANLPAQRGGMLPGDFVLRVGDSPVLSRTDLMREIGLLAPGTITRVKVWRPTAGRDIDLTIEIGKWPAVEEERIIASVPLRESWRGISYDYATARSKDFYAGSHNLFWAVRVMEVAPNSPAAARDIQPGDLITHVKGREVHSPRQFAEATAGDTGDVLLTVVTPSIDRRASRQVEIRPR